jgi:hypothetical protein
MRGLPGNMNKLMKQAKKMQKQMEQDKAQLEAKIYEATAGGGVVKCRINGNYDVLGIEIKPEAVDPDDVEMLQDLIMVAINEAVKEVRTEQETMMSDLTGGMKLPF